MAKAVNTALARAVAERQDGVAARLRAVFREWARSIAKKVARRLEGVLGKGDLPGHEFHGNQWTGGLGIDEKTGDVTTLHGTTTINAESIKANGFRPSDPASLAAAIEKEYGLPKDSVKDSSAYQFAMGRTDLGSVHFTMRPDTAASYTVPEQLQDALTAAYLIKHPETGDMNIKDAKPRMDAWIRKERDRLSKPEVLVVRIPWKAVGGNAFGRTFATPSEYQEAAGDRELPHAFSIPIAELSGAKIVGSYHPARKLLKASPTTEKLVEEILASLDLDAFGQDVVDEISDELEAMYRRASTAGLAQVKLEPTDEITNQLDEKAREYVATRGAELVGKKVLDDGSVVDNPNAKWSIDETTREDLRAVITDGVEQGWSARHLSDVIESSGAFDESRALMIARTELANAHVAGNVAGWEASGQVTGKRSILGDLHAEPDECDDNADAGVIDFNDDFPSGDAFPPYHPNCVCDVEPVLQGEES